MPCSVKISLFAFVAQAALSRAFLPTRSVLLIPSSKTPITTTPLDMVIEVGPTDDDIEDQNTPPGQMKISEIKSELDLRKVSYSDCFDRESLELRLNSARASGKADPSIIDEFNRRNQEADGKKLEVSEDMVENAVGGDGTLPGGMPPEMLMQMMQDEELVTMLRSPKMQEVMKVS